MNDIDETFNKLRRPTYAQMQNIWYSTQDPGIERNINAFFMKYGWTREEYMDEFARRRQLEKT